MPKFDPLAPLHNWDLQVELAGQVWTIPASPAADWALTILGDRPEFLLQMFAEDSGPLEDALLDGALEWAELEAVYRDVVAQVCGVRWWEGRKLLALALDWDGTGGELLLRGVRLEERSAAEVCVAVWRLITRNQSEKDLARVTMEIEKPPAGVDYEELVDEDANMQAMAAFGDD